MADRNQDNGGDVRIPISMTDLRSHELFLRTPPPELFHYTSLDGASGIIQSKSLHLTKFTYLNDRSELIHAIEQFRNIAHAVAKSSENDSHRRLLIDVANQISSFERTNICVASFCENPDLLSQWRSYGQVGRGVALGFSGPTLDQLKNRGWARLVRCIYHPDEQEQIIRELVEMLLRCFDIVTNEAEPQVQDQNRQDIIGYFNTTFLRVAPVLKHQSFEEEREWRIITVPRQTTDPKFQATVSNERLSEYYVHEFNADENGSYDFLRTIWVGPSDDAEVISETLFLLCMRNQILYEGTRYSQIPYRGHRR